MASLIWDGSPKGPRGWRRARILILVNDRRWTVRLGPTSKRAAAEWKHRIEQLVVDLRGGVAHDLPLVAWLQNLPDEAYRKLARVGLVPPRVRVEASRERTLDDLIAAFTSRATVKTGTAANYQQTLDSLRFFYGADRPLSAITAETADEWKVAISTAATGEGKRKKKRMRSDGRLAPATVSKRVRVGRQLFSKAVSWGWIESNPFQALTAGSQANPARCAYVDVPTTDAVLEACPGPEWRALVALTRFAGLRCPSEVGGLTWGDVDFHHGRLTVRSPKTEHHGHDHAVRFVPISPRLRAILMDAFDAAAPGETLVVPMAKGGANLRTGFERIILRASREPWPRLFQNLRASCETDWATQHPAHAVAKWLGHSPRIAQAHYLVTTDAHFKSVIEADNGLGKGGAQCGAVEAQNAAQQGSAMGTQRIARREQTEVIPVEYAISPMADENRENSLVGPV
jgi:integrase